MTDVEKEQPRETCWFVGASYRGGTEDQTQRFLEQGIWENGYEDQYLEQVKSIKPGDKIAIKSTYKRKKRSDLPFDNRNHEVSVMAIKAVGVVSENMMDGRTLIVKWQQGHSPREWFFFTYQKTIWKVEPKNWKKQALIDFTFNGIDQDIDRFRNSGSRQDRFGDWVESTGEEGEANDTGADPVSMEQQESYGVGNIVSDGCFIPVDKLEGYLDRLKDKKNIILQGPPGTGKTWLGKRLAYALIGAKNDNNVRAVQFHPNLSYEDFIRGWRPSGEGRLTLVDGPFLEMARAAREDPGSTYVIVIEEINRGNPAQIFGEMLTLLEADKRNPGEALQLSYKLSPKERVYIPENLYVIGTMNIADRSLALVDLALRRRFAFIDLVPTINQTWKDWVGSQFGMDSQILDDIQGRMLNLNNTISDDTTLGAQYRVGHSYVSPPLGSSSGRNARQWFRQVVETEIAPLLEEYWFDNLEKAETAKQQLLEGF
jgi:5-methylcytosine-specific restriction protein B